MGYTIYIKQSSKKNQGKTKTSHKPPDTKTSNITSYSFSYKELEDIVGEKSFNDQLYDSWKFWWILRYGKLSFEAFSNKPFNQNVWNNFMLFDSDPTTIRIKEKIPMELYSRADQKFIVIAQHINEIIDKNPDRHVIVTIR